MKSLDDLVVISYLNNDFKTVKETHAKLVKKLEELNRKKHLLDVSMSQESSKSDSLTLKDKYDLYKLLGFDNNFAQRVFEIDRQSLREKLVNSFSDLSDYLNLRNTIRNYEVSLDDVLSRTIDLRRIGISEKLICEHRFICVDDNLVCVCCGATTKEYQMTSDDFEFLVLCAEKQGVLLSEITKDDLPLLEVLKTEYKNVFPNCYKENYSDIVDIPESDSAEVLSDNEDFLSEISRQIRKAHLLDDGLLRNKNTRVSNPRYLTKENADKIFKLLQQQVLEIENSNSKFKDLLLESCQVVRYELLILTGNNIPKMYNEIQEEKEKIALIKAYYNLSQQEFRLDSGYFKTNNDAIFYCCRTANPEINTKILEMKQR